MRAMYRLMCAILAVAILHLCAVPCLAAGEIAEQGAASPGTAKVTVNDPQFIPLSEEQEIGKGIRWYWYLVGALVVGGALAASGGGGGGGGGGTTTPSTGSVTGTW